MSKDTAKSILNSNGRFPGDKLSLKEKKQKLYHYTSFETFVKIWLTKQLRFSAPEGVNDMMELSESIHPLSENVCMIFAYKDMRSKYKQISLSMNYDSYIKGCMSAMMWGHYGDKRRGVCIEFDYAKMPLNQKDMFHAPVKYKNVLHKDIYLSNGLKTITDIENYIITHRQEIFFTKQIDWKGENEYRIISNKLDYLDISNAITAVYLTSYESTECILVEKLVNNTIPVKQAFYTNQSGTCIPMISTLETKEKRAKISKSKNDSYYISIIQQAESLYQQMLSEANGSTSQEK